jgi:peptidyl-prolyl cis-trans isomerase A (cyclophilin A)
MKTSASYFFHQSVRCLTFVLTIGLLLSSCSQPNETSTIKPTVTSTEPSRADTPAKTTQPTKTTQPAQTALPHAVIQTSLGTISLELYPEQAPETVANFIQYARSGFYQGTLFHRVIPDFMIQGGGFGADMSRKTTTAPIQNEASPSLPNLRGTIAMARTSDPHSATSQFFINVKDNAFLNKSGANPGYAVFGRVTSGMDIADRISQVKTGLVQGMADVPLQAVTIDSVTIEQ